MSHRKVFTTVCAVLMTMSFFSPGPIQPTSGNGALNTYFTWEGYGNYSANGVGTWGDTSGTITINDIQSGAVIEKAFMYWVYNSNYGNDQNIILNGNNVVGQQAGVEGPLYGYRSDVTSLVTGNGNYVVSGLSSTYGVSIVVIYSDSSLNYVAIKINDGIDSNRGQSLPHWLTETTFTGFTATANPTAYTTYILADGQIYYQGATRHDKYSFNGNVIANDDADGSDGGSYDHGWDTDTYNVSPYVSAGDTTATANVYEDNDELWWVTQVLSITTVPPNNPPIADANGPYIGDEGSAITFDASSSSDPDGDALQYRWDFDNDGVWDTSWSSSSYADHTWGDDYSGTVILEVFDGVFSSKDSTAVTVNNVAPIVYAGPDQTVFEGDNLQFNGGFTDPGWLDSHDIEWDFDDGNTVADILTPIHVYGDNGIFTATLTVTDDDSGFGSDTIVLSVNNLAPTGGIISISHANEGSPIAFTSTATDPGSDDLTFTWNWGDGTSPTTNTYYNDGLGPDPLPSPSGIYPFTVTDTMTHTYGDNGVYNITLTVEDDDGGTSVMNTDVVIYNVAPTISFVITPSGDEGEELTFSADATDPGSDDLSFTWEFEHGPNIINIYYNDGMNPDPAQSPGGNYPFNASDTVIHTYGDDYNYTLVLTVTDDDGGITTYTTTITVDNWAPYIEELIIPYVAHEGTPSTFTATAVDQGSDDLTFEWEFGDWTPTITHIQYNDGIGPDPYPSPGDTYPFSATHTLNHTYGDNSNYTLMFTVTDDDGGQTIITTTVMVHNVAPTIQPFGPFEIDEGSPLDLTTISTDPGSDDLTFTWEFELGPTISSVHYNDGADPDPYPSPWGTFPFTATDTLTHTYGDNGIYSIILTVEDDDGGIAIYTTNVTVKNVAPTIEPFGPFTVDEGSSLEFTTTSTDPGSDDLTFIWEFEMGLTITNIYYNDGLGPDPYPSPWGTFPFSVSDMVEHTYGDDGVYKVTLTVEDDDAGTATYITNVTIDNIAPVIDTVTAPGGDEGAILTYTSSGTDPGSDDQTFTWYWGDGTSNTVTVHYNDGVGPDPFPSPGGTYPFTTLDTVQHTYGDNGVYAITLTVEDDDGDMTTYTNNVTIDNVAPTIEPFGPFAVDEGSPLNLEAICTDPGSDDLIFTWIFELGPTITNVYYNDGLGPDPYPSPWGAFPFNVADTVYHTYGDNGVYTLMLTVEDDDGAVDIFTTNVTVNNVAPTIVNLEAYMYLNFSLRVAGEKYHSVGIHIVVDGEEISSAVVTRYPGNPDEQTGSITGVKIDMTKNYIILVDYLPNDPGVNGNVWGGNPVWIDITFENGSVKRLHHTFNVRQSYWESDHWNHIDPWEVELNAHLMGYAFEITSHITDPGSDDIHLSYNYGSQVINVTYLNNPPNPDPYPSPEVKPVNVFHITTLIYEGLGTLTLQVEDDDGGTVTTNIVLG